MRSPGYTGQRLPEPYARQADRDGLHRRGDPGAGRGCGWWRLRRGPDRGLAVLQEKLAGSLAPAAVPTAATLRLRVDESRGAIVVETRLELA